MRDFVLIVPAGSPRLSAQIVLDFAFRNLDLAFHLTLTDARDRYFIADILAKLGVNNAIGFQRLTELLHVHLVVRRNALQCLVKLHIVDA